MSFNYWPTAANLGNSVYTHFILYNEILKIFFFKRIAIAFSVECLVREDIRNIIFT